HASPHLHAPRSAAAAGAARSPHQGTLRPHDSGQALSPRNRTAEGRRRHPAPAQERAQRLVELGSMATMKDVAKAAGVSIATVSATLSGASYVSPELKARVTEAIDILGYERNSVASGLKRGRTSLIGLIVSDVTNPFFTELVDCVQNEARR